MAEITNAIIEFFQNAFNNNSILTIIFISIFPIIELRGAIPVAVKLQMPWYEGLFYSWLGSSLVVPILLLLLMPILNAMKKTKWFKSLAHTIEGEFKGKADKIQNKIDAEASKRKSLWKKLLGVFAFVALPLPLTGVWTGSAVAVFLGLKFWQALPVVLLGNLTAGSIMTLLSYCLGEEAVDTILAVFFILVIVLVLFYVIKLVVKMKKNKKARMAEMENAEHCQNEDADSIADIENDAVNESVVHIDVTPDNEECVDDVKTDDDVIDD